jgi:acetyl-CoA synthetase
LPPTDLLDTTNSAVRFGEPADIRARGPRERRAVSSVTRDREPDGRIPGLPAGPGFTAQANATADLYAEAEADFEEFWAKRARERIDWSKPFEKTLEWDLPFAKWFTGGELNVAYNCVDRHVERGLGDKVAYHWIGEPGDTRTLTFRDLQREVSKAANALKELGVETGDRVAIYMPMIRSCPSRCWPAPGSARPYGRLRRLLGRGAVGRINDCGAKVLITADGGWRRGKEVGLKHHADEALASTPTIEHVDRRRRASATASTWSPAATTGGTTSSTAVRGLPAGPGRVGAHALPALHVGDDRQAEGDPAHTGRLPARHVVHPLGDLRRQARRRVLVRGRHRLGHRPQLHRLRPARQRDDRVMYEGAPDTPGWDRWWQIVEDYKVSILYCARRRSGRS